jgi:putative ABC transport system permease protein
MNLGLGVVEGLREIGSHKFRSLLTISGIILGVASLMAMFALTEGMAVQIRKSLVSIGGVERFSIQPTDPPPEQEGIREISPGLTLNDVVAIRRSAPFVRYVSGEVRVPGNSTLTRGNSSFQTNWIRGVHPDQIFLDNMILADGRFITDLDLEQVHRVVVIGAGIAQALFPGREDPVGKIIRINDIDFTVIGHFLSTPDLWRNNRAFIPLTTAQSYFKGANIVGGVDQGPDLKLDSINVKVGSLSEFNSAIDQLRNVLDQTHRGIQDFGFNTREDWFDGIESGVRSARVSGGLIALVSLLAGGVGITNIMLASIKERTRELGVRRAIGARPADLFFQICIEAALLAVIGGVLGLLVGLGLVQVLKGLSPPESPPVLQSYAIAISLASGVIVGLVAGLIPAWKASQLHPIEALRFE